MKSMSKLDKPISGFRTILCNGKHEALILRNHEHFDECTYCIIKIKANECMIAVVMNYGRTCNVNKASGKVYIMGKPNKAGFLMDAVGKSKTSIMNSCIHVVHDIITPNGSIYKILSKQLDPKFASFAASANVVLRREAIAFPKSVYKNVLMKWFLV